MPTQHFYLFPDTNALLHYPQLKDVDWRKVCDAESVTLVFCMHVIHELDEKKSDSRLRTRAERAIKEIKANSAGQPVRDRVTIEIFNVELRTSDFPDTLNPESGDDRIVHSVKKYLERVGQQSAAVYSEDLGMSLRCQTHEIPVIEPDKGTRLEAPQTEQDRKYKDAITELNRYKNLQPKIEVCLYPPNEPHKNEPFVVTLKRPTLQNVDGLIELERQFLGFDHQETPSSLHGRYRPLSAFEPTKEDWEGYYKRCDTYLTKYRDWLHQRISMDSNDARGFTFGITVANVGTTFGTDVDVYLTFPPLLSSIEGDGNDPLGKYVELPPQPERPEKPKTRAMFAGLENFARLLPEQVLYSNLGHMSSISDNIAKSIAKQNGPWSSLSGDSKNGFGVRLFLPKLNHYKCKSFGPFNTYFADWDHAKSFEIELTIMAANQVNKIESKIPVVVTVADTHMQSDHGASA